MNFLKHCHHAFAFLFFILFASPSFTAATTTAQARACADAPVQQQVKPTTIIFDLGGVLFDTSRTGISGEMHCSWDFIQYALHFQNPSKIKNVAFSIFDSIFGPQQPPAGDYAAMADGTVMPKIMCDLMCGTPGSDIIALLDKELETGRHDKLFSCAVEKRLVKKIAGIMFNPEIIAKHTHPIKEGLEILDLCAKNENVTLMVLSNYAADAFEELYNRKEAQKVFCYFAPEKIVVSGFVGTMKPYRAIFDYIIKGYHLDPTTCLFIDDQKENIQAANKAGFQTIRVRRGNFGAVRKKLEKLGVLATA